MARSFDGVALCCPVTKRYIRRPGHAAAWFPARELRQLMDASGLAKSPLSASRTTTRAGSFPRRSTPACHRQEEFQSGSVGHLCHRHGAGSFCLLTLRLADAPARVSVSPPLALAEKRPSFSRFGPCIGSGRCCMVTGAAGRREAETFPSASELVLACVMVRVPAWTPASRRTLHRRWASPNDSKQRPIERWMLTHTQTHPPLPNMMHPCAQRRCAPNRRITIESGSESPGSGPNDMQGTTPGIDVPQSGIYGERDTGFRSGRGSEQ